MPFIDSKVTVTMPEFKKENIKARLGKAVSLIGKTEEWLMVGFDDRYDLFMGGKKLDRGAYVSVSLFGEADSAAYEKMTEEICRIFSEELSIPKENIYVTYHGIRDWGWNGSNF